MTAVSQIITEAFRESNNIPAGDLPTNIEQVEGLNIFNRMVRAVLGTEAGDPFTNYSIGNNGVDTTTISNPTVFPVGWYPPINSRIICNINSAQSFYLNPFPQDGERFAINDASSNFATYPVTMNGNGRTIDGATSVVLNTNGFKAEYFYRADLNDWQTVSNLTLTSNLPFPQEFEDMFIIGLAMRINPRNGTNIDPQSVEAYKRLKSMFKARYSITSKQDSEEGLLRTTGVRLRSRTIRGYDRFITGY
jgi:hypothetical protein